MTGKVKQQVLVQLAAVAMTFAVFEAMGIISPEKMKYLLTGIFNDQGVNAEIVVLSGLGASALIGVIMERGKMLWNSIRFRSGMSPVDKKFRRLGFIVGAAAAALSIPLPAVGLIYLAVHRLAKGLVPPLSDQSHVHSNSERLVAHLFHLA